MLRWAVLRLAATAVAADVLAELADAALLPLVAAKLLADVLLLLLFKLLLSTRQLLLLNLFISSKLLFKWLPLTRLHCHQHLLLIQVPV